MPCYAQHARTEHDGNGLCPRYSTSFNVPAGQEASHGVVRPTSAEYVPPLQGIRTPEPATQYSPDWHCATPLRRDALPASGVEYEPGGTNDGLLEPLGQYTDALPHTKGATVPLPQ